MPGRHAVYFAPAEDSPWWAAGSRWLGRDAATGASLEQPGIDGLDAAGFRALTGRPRHYGFHATIKAPFELREDLTAAALADAVDAFCAARAPFQMPPLQVARLREFLALVPAARETRINDLAADCVRELDRHRAPLAPADVERRRLDGLTPRQDRYMLEWGYPYVLADFRFHLTMSDALATVPAPHAAAVQRAAERLLAVLADTPLWFDALCLFSQPDRAAPFRLVARFPLGRGGRRPGAGPLSRGAGAP